jgi:hypothetical protein
MLVSSWCHLLQDQFRHFWHKQTLDPLNRFCIHCFLKSCNNKVLKSLRKFLPYIFCNNLQLVISNSSKVQYLLILYFRYVSSNFTTLTHKHAANFWLNLLPKKPLYRTSSNKSYLFTCLDVILNDMHGVSRRVWPSDSIWTFTL